MTSVSRTLENPYSLFYLTPFLTLGHPSVPTIPEKGKEEREEDTMKIFTIIHGLKRDHG